MWIFLRRRIRQSREAQAFSARPSGRRIAHPRRHRQRRLAPAILRRNIIIHQRLKRIRQLVVGPLKRREMLPININGATRRLASPRQTNPNIRAFDSPGPFTMQPITASFNSSTPSNSRFHSGIFSHVTLILSANS